MKDIIERLDQIIARLQDLAGVKTALEDIQHVLREAIGSSRRRTESKVEVVVVENKKLYSIKQAAAISGLSIAWWKQAVWKKRIPVIKMGRRVMIRRETLEKLCDEGY